MHWEDKILDMEELDLRYDRQIYWLLQCGTLECAASGPISHRDPTQIQSPSPRPSLSLPSFKLPTCSYVNPTLWICALKNLLRFTELLDGCCCLTVTDVDTLAGWIIRQCGQRINKLRVKVKRKIQFSHSTSRVNMALANNMSGQANKGRLPPPLPSPLRSPPPCQFVTALPVRKLIKTSGKSAAGRQHHP